MRQCLKADITKQMSHLRTDLCLIMLNRFSLIEDEKRRYLQRAENRIREKSHVCIHLRQNRWKVKKKIDIEKLERRGGYPNSLKWPSISHYI
ncbi:hypothetical protein ACS0PU_010746 [Formica fusca]